jgi:hypothetical protein
MFAFLLRSLVRDLNGDPRVPNRPFSSQVPTWAIFRDVFWKYRRGHPRHGSFVEAGIAFFT